MFDRCLHLPGSKWCAWVDGGWPGSSFCCLRGLVQNSEECCSSLLFIVIQWYVSQNEMCGTLQTSVRTVQANTLSTCNAATLQDKTEMLDSESFSHSGCFELGVAMVVIAGQQVGLWRKARRGSEDFRKTIELSWILPSCGHVEAARHDFLVHRYDVCQHQVHGVGKSM